MQKTASSWGADATAFASTSAGIGPCGSDGGPFGMSSRPEGDARLLGHSRKWQALFWVCRLSCYDDTTMETKPSEAAEPYENDFYRWAMDQAAALRERRLADLDVSNLGEEIEELAVSQKRAVRSYLRVIFHHLLKFEAQPEMASGSWQVSILNAGAELRQLLEDSPSLHHAVVLYEDQAYEQARKLAKADTGLPLSAFPEKRTKSLDDRFGLILAGQDFGAEDAIEKADSRRR